MNGKWKIDPLTPNVCPLGKDFQVFAQAPPRGGWMEANQSELVAATIF
jgi:hypothetical protein